MDYIQVPHPAKYSDNLLPILETWLSGYEKVLDPFAGTGKIRQICPNIILNELEFSWAKQSGGICGDALHLPFPDGIFDAVVTSPTYGNRMADHHNARDESRRVTYKHFLGRQLSELNSGRIQWGNQYKLFHTSAWKECSRILRTRGRLILNCSDHIRNNLRVAVTEFHVSSIVNLGFSIVHIENIQKLGMRYGANSSLRVPHESIIIFEKDDYVNKSF